MGSIRCLSVHGSTAPTSELSSHQGAQQLRILWPGSGNRVCIAWSLHENLRSYLKRVTPDAERPSPATKCARTAPLIGADQCARRSSIITWSRHRDLLQSVLVRSSTIFEVADKLALRPRHYLQDVQRRRWLISRST